MRAMGGGIEECGMLSGRVLCGGVEGCGAQRVECEVVVLKGGCRRLRSREVELVGAILEEGSPKVMTVRKNL